MASNVDIYLARQKLASAILSLASLELNPDFDPESETNQRVSQALINQVEAALDSYVAVRGNPPVGGDTNHTWRDVAGEFEVQLTQLKQAHHLLEARYARAINFLQDEQMQDVLRIVDVDVVDGEVVGITEADLYARGE